MRRRIRLMGETLTPLAASALALGLLAAGAMGAGIAHVSQQNRAFSVLTIQVARGDTVRFTNEDEFTHQIYVESPAMSFESDEQNPGEVVDVPFTAAGTFPVQCHIHPKMHLEVTVR
jgi:plastocyanin